MSVIDRVTRLLATHWVDGAGKRLPVKSLPGLPPTALQGLESLYPDIVHGDFSRLLQISCGVTGTALGDIDFTGQWHPEEPLGVFRPCVSLAIDSDGRRWIAEARENGLPGPVWCIFREPAVTVYVSDDLSEFVTTLHERTCQDRVREWLQDLAAQARIIWLQGRALGIRFRTISQEDGGLCAWVSSLPLDSYVYDLRGASVARGWPHGLAGSSGQIYRCGRLAIFAVSGAAPAVPAETANSQGPRPPLKWRHESPTKKL